MDVGGSSVTRPTGFPNWHGLGAGEQVARMPRLMLIYLPMLSNILYNKSQNAMILNGFGVNLRTTPNQVFGYQNRVLNRETTGRGWNPHGSNS